jgi:hypothetical protein
MHSFSGSTSIPLADAMGSVIPYRFAPAYTMCHVGVEPMFRPTGGQLLFKLVKPDSIKRKIMTRDYSDVVTLGELDDILTEANPKSRAVEMYRPALENDGGDGTLSLSNLAENIRAFGVSSIYQCKDWHKDFMTTVQPVMISGACHADRTDFAKQDTLRLPAGMCDIVRGNPQDPRHFVYMTFENSTGKGWRPRFVVTPKSSWANERMMESHGMSLVYPLGIVDYVNLGQDNTSVYMFKPSAAMGGKPEEAVWMIEGFVFNPLASWILTYPKDPLEFYNPTSPDLWGVLNGPNGGMLRHDPATKTLLPCLLEMMKKAREEEDNDYDEEEEEEAEEYSEAMPGNKRKRGGGGGGGGGSKRPRFVGFGPSGYAQQQQQQQQQSGSAVDLKHYTEMDPQHRGTSAFPPPNPAAALTFTLDKSKPNPRRVSRDLLAKITAPFRQIVNNFWGALNSYVEREMSNDKRIRLHRLFEGDGVDVSAKDTFLVLAMAFLDRLRITGRDSKVAYQQLDMTGLFNGRVAKLTCLVNYFVKGLTNQPFLLQRTLTFYHKGTTSPPPDTEHYIYAPADVVAGAPNIEDVPGAVFADFANRRFGGGVMGTGAVQEEIQLIIHPEALLGRALFEPMAPTGACVVMGAVRVSDYSGYGRGGRFGVNAFTYAGTVQYDRNQPLDGDGRALTEILAFNAKDFKGGIRDQYGGRNIIGEFQRAAAAFSENPLTDKAVPIVTGLWGSGDYGGDPVLKTLLQTAAASATGRSIILVRVGDKVKRAVDRIMGLAEVMGLTVKDFLGYVIDGVRAQTYGTDKTRNARITADGVYDTLMGVHQSKMRGSQFMIPAPSQFQSSSSTLSPGSMYGGGGVGSTTMMMSSSSGLGGGDGLIVPASYGLGEPITSYSTTTDDDAGSVAKEPAVEKKKKKKPKQVVQAESGLLGTAE